MGTLPYNYDPGEPMEISRRTALAGALLATGSSLIPGRRFSVGEAQAAKGSGEAVVVIGAGMAGL